MPFVLTPGNALGCNVNAHRSGWNGVICKQAVSWNCSAEQEFREGYCAKDSPRCYHLHLFDAEDPHFMIDDNGAGWILGERAHAFDDQVLLFLGQEFAEPQGIREVTIQRRLQIYGAYRIQSCTRLTQNYRTLWRVQAHRDGWTRFHLLRVRMPRMLSTGGPYVKQVEAVAVTRLFEEAYEQSTDGHGEWFEAGDQERFQHFRENLKPWMQKAKEAALKLGFPPPGQIPARTVFTAGPLPRSPMDQLRKVVPVEERPRISEPKPSPAAPPAELPKPQPSSSLLDPTQHDWIKATYGEATLQALRVAAMTKPLLILRGSPGVGKSHLAVRLLNDPKRERTLVVPVVATWRGREDLLGYVNPLTSLFEPTAFTQFLLKAARDWAAGDLQTRVVVFEEFNLSQPEHWMSDILVASQPSDLADRTIHLGGESIRGEPRGPATVALSPALRFVATINNDHTTRTLSPRVIDRAAVIELTLEPREALVQAGVQLAEEQILAIADLEFPLRAKGAAFSIRSARSLNACRQRSAEIGLDTWQTIDLILMQEVLSKVRLLARDPQDESLLRGIEKWREQYGRNLPRCSSLIAEWKEMLGSGIDVVQA